jgi:hypothetical protein
MRRLVLAGVVVAVAATGCNSKAPLNGAGPGQTSPSAAVSAGPGAGTSTGPGTSHTAGPVTVYGKSTRACYSMGLHASLAGYDAGAGQRYVRLILTNLTSHPCKTYGWPGLELLGAGNAALGTHTTRTGSPTALVLAAGGHAYSRLHWTVVPAGDETGNPCEPTVTALQVIPPDQTTPVFTPWSGGTVCQHFSLSETPLAAGTGA